MVYLSFSNNFYYPLVKTKCTKVRGKESQNLWHFSSKVKFIYNGVQGVYLFSFVYFCVCREILLHTLNKRGITQSEKSQISKEFPGTFSILRWFIFWQKCNILGMFSQMRGDPGGYFSKVLTYLPFPTRHTCKALETEERFPPKGLIFPERPI